MTKTNFPDKKYLDNLIRHEKEKSKFNDPMDRLMAYSGMSLNWIADYVTDESIRWKKQKLPIKNLYLTGTKPEWNAIIIGQCQRSPQRLKELLKSNLRIKRIFQEAEFKNIPILVRYEDKEYKVLEGMHRAVAAIRDNRQTINAFVAYRKGKFRPRCEAHVIYDLLKAYHRGINKDRNDLIAALRFLSRSYTNVRSLLKNRFSKPYIPSDDKIQDIIREVLKTKNKRVIK